MAGRAPVDQMDQELSKLTKGEDRITAFLLQIVTERLVLWFAILSATGLAAYAVTTAPPGWMRLAGVAGYALMIFTPVLYRAWGRK